MSQAAIVIEGLSKRFGAPRPAPGVPEWLWRRAQGAEASAPVEDEEEAEDEEGREPASTVREVWALRDIWLEVPRGVALGVVGGSGSGKTTLLKVLSRLTTPTEGRVIVRGRVAPMAQTVSTLMRSELTGRKNVYLLASFFRVPREVVDRRIDAIAEFAEVDARIDTKLRDYSPGLRRRLGLSVILNLEPDVLLADGSLVSGDEPFRERCLARVRELHEEGMTLLLAASDVKTVRPFCHEALFLQEGRALDRGHPDEIAERWAERRARERAMAPHEETEALRTAEDPAVASYDDAVEAPPVAVADRLQLRGEWTPGPLGAASLPYGEYTALLTHFLTADRGAQVAHALVSDADRLARESDDPNLRWPHLARAAGLAEAEGRELVDRLAEPLGLRNKRRVFNENLAIAQGAAVEPQDRRHRGDTPDGGLCLEVMLEVAVPAVAVLCTLRVAGDEGSLVRLVQPHEVVLRRTGPWRVAVHVPAGLLVAGFYSVEVIVSNGRRGGARGVVSRTDVFGFRSRPSPRAPGDGPVELVWEIDHPGGRQ